MMNKTDEMMDDINMKVSFVTILSRHDLSFETRRELTTKLNELNHKIYGGSDEGTKI